MRLNNSFNTSALSFKSGRQWAAGDNRALSDLEVQPYLSAIARGVREGSINVSPPERPNQPTKIHKIEGSTEIGNIKGEYWLTQQNGSFIPHFVRFNLPTQGKEIDIINDSTETVGQVYELDNLIQRSHWK